MASHLKYFLSSRESIFIGMVFACNSMLFGNWVTRIPDIKESLSLSDAELGLALLGAPVGALLIMPLSGWVIARFQLGRTVVFSAILHTASLPILALTNSFWALTVALVLFGFTNAIMDISMNAAAAGTEKQLRKPIMSTCHGMWSIGAMLGSGIGSLFVGLEVTPLIHLLIIAFVVFFIIAGLSGLLLRLSEARNKEDKLFALPKGVLLLLAFLAFCILMSEGAIADWSAVYMKEVIHADPYLTGLAFSGFALFMALGRLSGDAMIPRYGKKKLIFFGALIGSLGLVVALVVSNPYLVILGFSITGLGYSCLVPVLFISAANVPGYTSGTGIAAVTTLGYAGFLIGPPLIGLLSEQYGLTIGLCFVLFCALLVSILSLTIKFE